MLITKIENWAKSLFQKILKPQTYGSELESYIVSNQPKDSYDVDRLTKQYESMTTTRTHGGYPL